MADENEALATEVTVSPAKPYTFKSSEGNIRFEAVCDDKVASDEANYKRLRPGQHSFPKLQRIDGVLIDLEILVTCDEPPPRPSVAETPPPEMVISPLILGASTLDPSSWPKPTPVADQPDPFT
jgi:hypothetical protein